MAQQVTLVVPPLVTLATMFLVLGGCQVRSEQSVSVSEGRPQTPLFEVDPLWPKPLPNHWVLGQTVGVAVDKQNHVWIIHRPDSVDDNFKAAVLDPKVGDCCVPAPPVLEFDQEGDLVGNWGGPGEGYEWPESNHGITVDDDDHVWIGSNGARDRHVLKFRRDGQFLLQIGRQGVSEGSSDIDNLGRPAQVLVDPVANEAYIADGYGNRRVIVYDANTGEYKRHWGAYGNKPNDTPIPGDFARNNGYYDPDGPPHQQFMNPVHCVELSNDGLLYVCDRNHNRIQVFTKDGTFVKEAFVEERTLRSGAVWDIGLSRDQQQTYLYVADGVNQQIHILRRDTLEVLTSFGDGGRQPGQFYGVHNLAVDSRGNIYTTETYSGARVQRFLYRGLGPVRAEEQGVPWPDAQ